jgi:hypothetical protein
VEASREWDSGTMVLYTGSSQRASKSHSHTAARQTRTRTRTRTRSTVGRVSTLCQGTARLLPSRSSESVLPAGIGFNGASALKLASTRRCPGDRGLSDVIMDVGATGKDSMAESGAGGVGMKS